MPKVKPNASSNINLKVAWSWTNNSKSSILTVQYKLFNVVKKTLTPFANVGISLSSFLKSFTCSNDHVSSRSPFTLSFLLMPPAVLLIIN